VFIDDLKPDDREQFGVARVSLGTKHIIVSTKLYVGNLSYNTTENDLHDAFAAHGTVVEANLMVDRMSGRPRGFGFVTMSTEEEAQKAIEALNGSSLDGRNLTVNIARPKEERPAGGGGGGFRGGRERGGYGRR
jgi:cold-inducible RNA-binding protein